MCIFFAQRTKNFNLDSTHTGSIRLAKFERSIINDVFCTPRPLISVVTKSVDYTSPFILQNVAYFKNHEIGNRYQDFVLYISQSKIGVL